MSALLTEDRPRPPIRVRQPRPGAVAAAERLRRAHQGLDRFLRRIGVTRRAPTDIAALGPDEPRPAATDSIRLYTPPRQDGHPALADL